MPAGQRQMVLLIDENVPNSVVEFFKDRGHEVRDKDAAVSWTVADIRYDATCDWPVRLPVFLDHLRIPTPSDRGDD